MTTGPEPINIPPWVGTAGAIAALIAMVWIATVAVRWIGRGGGRAFAGALMLGILGFWAVKENVIGITAEDFAWTEAAIAKWWKGPI